MQDRRLSHLPSREGASRSGSNGSTGGQATGRAEVAQKAMESNHTVMDHNCGHEKDDMKLETTPPSFALIYEPIMVQHKQTQWDSKKVRVATKQLKVAVSKIAKSCSDIGERIAAIETGAEVLETDLGAVTKQTGMHDTQLIDIQWKIEDFENRRLTVFG
ncbi:hypothetical protein NDU88_006234 [Pleurodeles waltl]|uniref:Uncharacterized protein n=1 Tax=Pleurodeles waltl TaxID=8319 RepID=A0AAV7TCT4_PLEWA|nr:hypothetical protein NDU88_006234 [Pleurodeles waltl]